MYTESDRKELLDKTLDFFEHDNNFEGVVQIGSGTLGFADIYSDIDLMAGCFDENSLCAAKNALIDFFHKAGACYVEERVWNQTALGLSVFFENGLSIDLSYMPTAQIPIKSPQHKIVLSKTENFSRIINESSCKFSNSSAKYGIDDSVHYRFIQALRYAEIAALRGEYIFADISLNNARQILLSVKAVSEGKKLHQFKSFNSLEKSFTTRLERTYPHSQDRHAITKAKQYLLSLYLETVEHCDFLNFNYALIKLLNCFELDCESDCISLELLDKNNIDAVRRIDRSDISEEFVDTVDTIMNLTQYGLEHNCIGHTYAIKYCKEYIGIILLGEAIPWESDPDEMRKEPFYRLMGYVIDQKYRNKGIGGYVLEKVIDKTYNEFGIRPIALGVHRDNDAAARFYLSHGFVKTDALEGNDIYYLRYPKQ